MKDTSTSPRDLDLSLLMYVFLRCLISIMVLPRLEKVYHLILVVSDRNFPYFLFLIASIRSMFSFEMEGRIQ